MRRCYKAVGRHSREESFAETAALRARTESAWDDAV